MKTKHDKIVEILRKLRDEPITFMTETIQRSAHLQKEKDEKEQGFLEKYTIAIEELYEQETQDEKDMIKYAKHIHCNNGVDDSCKICGHDLRHRIHLRIGEENNK